MGDKEHSRIGTRLGCDSMSVHSAESHFSTSSRKRHGSTDELRPGRPSLAALGED